MKRSSNISGSDSSIENLSKLISSKALSPVDLIEYTFQQIHKLNPTLNAFITVLEDSARKEAKEAESLIIQGKYKGPLHGIPVSLKDLIFVKGVTEDQRFENPGRLCPRSRFDGSKKTKSRWSNHCWNE